MCILEVITFSGFDVKISLKDFKLFEMTLNHVFIGGQVFMLDGWEVRLYVITPSLSACVCVNITTTMLTTTNYTR